MNQIVHLLCLYAHTYTHMHACMHARTHTHTHTHTQRGDKLVEYHGKTKKTKELTKDDIKPPDGWIWKDTEWKIDRNRAVDEKGEYISCMCVCLCASVGRISWCIKSIEYKTFSCLPSFLSFQDGSTVPEQT